MIVPTKLPKLLPELISFHPCWTSKLHDDSVLQLVVAGWFIMDGNQYPYSWKVWPLLPLHNQVYFLYYWFFKLVVIFNVLLVLWFSVPFVHIYWLNVGFPCSHQLNCYLLIEKMLVFKNYNNFHRMESSTFLTRHSGGVMCSL